MAHRILLLTLTAIICIAPGVIAGGSVFSANNLGEQAIGGGVRAQGLGGGGFGLIDSMSFNTTNPALSAWLPRTMLRMSGQMGVWSTTGADGAKDTDGEFLWQDLCVYFPVTHIWKIGLGAAPSRRMDLLTMGMRTADFYIPDDDTTVTVDYEERDNWTGSTVDWRIDNAVRINEEWSLGLSAVYTVLHNERIRTLDMTEAVRYSYYFDTEYKEVETFRQWSPIVGVHGRLNSRWGIGAAFRPRSRGIWHYEYYRNGGVPVEEHSRHAYSPADFKLGVSWRFADQTVAVADVNVGQWARESMGLMAEKAGAGEPVNPLFISMGIERTAANVIGQTGFENWGMRGGCYYRKHYWPEQNGAAVEDLGITAGMSVPIGVGLSRLHTAFDLGMRGFDKEKLGAKETYFRFSLQAEIGELWFQRTRPRVPK